MFELVKLNRKSRNSAIENIMDGVIVKLEAAMFWISRLSVEESPRERYSLLRQPLMRMSEAFILALIVFSSRAENGPVKST